MHGVPARVRDRQLVQAQLARVEQAEQVDLAEVPLAQRPVLLRAVLAHVPRVARALRAGRRERQHVRRRDVGDAARPDQVAEPVQHRVGVLDVLDRLQEHDAVDVAVHGSIMSRSKRTLARVLQRACSNASGLASTPTTEAAVRPSTALP